MREAIAKSQLAGEYYTVIELAAGGGCSVLSSVRSKFRHLFVTETDDVKSKMSEMISGAPCLGDTFLLDFEELKKKYGHCNYLKSGMPCKDFSACPTSKGRRPGAQGKTGWMFVKQVQFILKYEPDVRAFLAVSK